MDGGGPHEALPITIGLPADDSQKEDPALKAYIQVTLCRLNGLYLGIRM